MYLVPKLSILHKQLLHLSYWLTLVLFQQLFCQRLNLLFVELALKVEHRYHYSNHSYHSYYYSYNYSYHYSYHYSCK